MSEWIRIVTKEDLPKAYQAVNIWMQGWPEAKVGYWRNPSGKMKAWRVLNAATNMDGITHWQPLPAPPTE